MNYSSIIHLVNIDPVVRASLVPILDKADYAVRLHDDAGRFFDHLDTSGRGCVVTYVDMPELIGVEFLRDARTRLPHLPVVVITAQATIRGAIQVMKEGAFDLVELPLNEEKLLAAVRQALSRRPDFRPIRTKVGHLPGRLSALTSRENDVLAGLVEGKLNKVIAHELGISARTVETHRSHIMTKMRVKSVADLVRVSLGAGREETGRLAPPSSLPRHPPQDAQSRR